MIFLETLFQPSENQKQIFEYVESSHFPWFFQEIILNPLEEAKDSLYAHTLRSRHGDGSLPVEGKNNSGVMQAMEDIFFEIAKNNKVEINTVLRSAVNATHHSKQSRSEVYKFTSTVFKFKFECLIPIHDLICNAVPSPFGSHSASVITLTNFHYISHGKTSQ